MFNSKNIIWVKNVKRSGGADWAYASAKCDTPFLLHWPTSRKGSASKPRVGDIILLFQKPTKVNGRRNYSVHLTHLVAPISERITAVKNNPTHKWCRKVKLIAKADPINSIPNPGYFNFFLPNRGLTNPIVNLVNRIGLTESETQDRLWELFQNYFCPNILHDIYDLQVRVGIHGEVEGDKVVKKHIRQEVARRNSLIVQRAKSEAVKRGNGKLFCECCDFDFQAAYGELGKGFIECHHKVHISTGQRITRIQDLALVCSNCHRMLHKKISNGNYLKVEELRGLIQAGQHQKLLNKSSSLTV